MRAEVLALAVALWALPGCDGPQGAPTADGSADPYAGGWVEAAATVQPSIHSVWGSRPALGGERTAFTPVGTAFSIARDGLLLTAAHVLVAPDSTPLPNLHVLVHDDTASTLYALELVDLDLLRDLALVRVPDTTLVPVRWTDRRAPTGAPLATLGYGLPEGGIVDTAGAAVKTEYTVVRRFTAGFSSAYRTLEVGDPSTNVLEVDLFLFPGVSGGPTFGLDGRVVGVNRGHRLDRRGAPTSYGYVTPRLVVGQFLAAGGTGVDTARVFRR